MTLSDMICVMAPSVSKCGTSEKVSTASEVVIMKQHTAAVHARDVGHLLCTTDMMLLLLLLADIVKHNIRVSLIAPCVSNWESIIRIRGGVIHGQLRWR